MSDELHVWKEVQSIDLDDTQGRLVDIRSTVNQETKTTELEVIFQDVDGNSAARWLSRKQVARLIPYLQHFAKTGELVE